MPHKCKNSHINNIDFGEEVRVRCPTPDCDAMVSRTADFIVIAPEQKGAEIEVKQDQLFDRALRWAIAHKVQLGGGIAVVIAATIFMAYYPTPPKTQNSESVIPMVKSEQGQEANDTTPPRNAISEISITDFKTTMLAGLNTRISFNLVNSGQNNEYPIIVITWRGIDAKPIEILGNAYPHPNSPFTILPVEFEIARPASATGVDVSVKY